MPRKPKQDQDGTVHAAKTGANGINEGQLKGFVAEYEDEMEKVDAIMKDAAIACQPHVDQMKAIAKEAAEAEIPKKVFKAKIRERSLLRKADAVRATLSESQQDIYDEISAKLGQFGDTPLGSAALDRARPQEGAAAN